MAPKSMKRQGGRPCSVCTHPQLGEIDAMILDHKSDPKVAEAFQLNKAAIQNHRTKHLPITLANTIADLDAVATAPIKMALAKQSERLSFQQARYEAMRVILEERGIDMADVPGGRSGMLARTFKQIGSGDSAEKVEEYKVDAALLKEFRELEKQISEELGQYQREAGTHQQTGPLVVIIKPTIGVNMNQRELPVAQVLEHPEGAPKYLSPASSDVIDAELIEEGETLDTDEVEGARGNKGTWF